MSLKVLFFGNHTVGVQVLKALQQENCLCGVVAHPEDPEDGVRYESVYEWAKAQNIPATRATPKSPLLLKFIKDINPDLIWVTDYRYLLPSAIFSLPKLGSVNLHPSLLPKYRGRASLNWAMINGEKEVGLTAHYIDKGIDTGDIITQLKLAVRDTDYIGDVLEKIYPLYNFITKNVIKMFATKRVNRTKQDISDIIVYSSRKPEEGLIDLSKDAHTVLNFIKALSKPYPGAFLIENDKKIIIWKANLSQENFPIIGLHESNDKKYIQSSVGCLLVDEYEYVE